MVVGWRTAENVLCMFCMQEEVTALLCVYVIYVYGKKEEFRFRFCMKVKELVVLYFSSPVVLCVFLYEVVCTCACVYVCVWGCAYVNFHGKHTVDLLR